MTQQFKRGDLVRNVNSASLHFGKSGVFQCVHEKWVFVTGLACDVSVDGGYGPYECEDVIMCVNDLVLVTESEAA
jgi:hypothetical protein